MHKKTYKIILSSVLTSQVQYDLKVGHKVDRKVDRKVDPDPIYEQNLLRRCKIDVMSHLKVIKAASMVNMKVNIMLSKVPNQELCPTFNLK